MRKVLFLMFLLLLMGLGAAGVKAQVRIGGNGSPNAAAVLDLNATDGTNNGTKGLALPRVTLGSNTATLDGTTANINGMLVYNTGGTLSAGIYFWNGSVWNQVDDAIGNELSDTITGGGLTKSGSGTAANPWKVGIKDGGVTNAKIAAGSIDTSKLSTVGVQGTNSIMYTAGGIWHVSRPKMTNLPAVTITPNMTAVVRFLGMTTIPLPASHPFDSFFVPINGITGSDICNSDMWGFVYDVTVDAGQNGVYILNRGFETVAEPSYQISCYGIR